jgi:hypothetical protein
MKRLSAALFLGFLVSSLCPAQIQTGNASLNSSKPGLAISHSSLSFNTRVRVTNLRNNRSVEAVVNGRIPIESGRIADISREAGAALGMDPAGLTLVEIEVLSHGSAGGAAPAAAGSEPQPAGTAVSQQAPSPPAQEQVPSSSAVREQTPSSSSSQVSPPPQILPVQTVTDIQYVPVPGPVQSNCCTPLLWVVLLLLLLVIIILTVILALILRRLLLWPWNYQVWYRRHLLCAKKRRRETAP